MILIQVYMCYKPNRHNLCKNNIQNTYHSFLSQLKQPNATHYQSYHPPRQMQYQQSRVILLKLISLIVYLLKKLLQSPISRIILFYQSIKLLNLLEMMDLLSLIILSFPLHLLLPLIHPKQAKAPLSPLQSQDRMVRIIINHLPSRLPLLKHKMTSYNPQLRYPRF